MKKTFLFLFLICFSHVSVANIIIDIYGANKVHEEIILQKYAKKIIAIESEQFEQLQHKSIAGQENIKKVEALQIKKARLIEDIQKENDFLYVNIHTTRYQDEKNKYTTVEVIEKNQPERLQFIEHNHSVKKHHIQSDLVDKMIEYDNLGHKLFFANQLNSNNLLCPVYHCSSGFHHQSLKPYLNLFNTGVIKEKKQILDVLNHDSDPERQAAAVFLVGHFQNPKEIISLLEEHIDDTSAHVRNNAMRVISATMDKAKIDTINVVPYLNLLNSPYGTDRNKALAILFSASKNPSAKAHIIQNGGDNLLKILELKQPNNHDYAYILLKSISGKNYNEYDLNAWKNWLSTVQKV